MPTLLQLAARSICRNKRCISPSVDPHQGVHQPTLEPGRQDTHPDANPTSHHSTGNTNMEILAMVPYTPIHVDRLPKANNNRNRNNGEQGPLLDAPTTGRMAYLRERYRNQQQATETNSKLQTSCLVPGELKQTSPVTHCLPNSIAGVLNRVQILFLLL